MLQPILRRSMRCYFNLVGVHQTIVDDKGVEVTDPDEARTHALEAVWELIQEGEEVADWRGWRLEVADASGTVLFLIRLDALPN